MEEMSVITWKQMASTEPCDRHIDEYFEPCCSNSAAVQKGYERKEDRLSSRRHTRGILTVMEAPP